jgi:hypothetical protein
MEDVMDNLSSCYLLPKGVAKANQLFVNLEGPVLLLYAILYTKSICFDFEIDDDPGVLLGDDGRRLFVTCTYEELGQELGFYTADLVKSYLDVLGRYNLVNVIEQRRGVPPVIFVYAPMNQQIMLAGYAIDDDDTLVVSESGDVVVKADSVDAVDSPDGDDAGDGAPYGEISDIIACWHEVFNAYPDADVLNALIVNLAFMDKSVIRYAIYACAKLSDNVFGSVIKILEECKKSGIKHIDNIDMGGDDADGVVEEPGLIPEPDVGGVALSGNDVSASGDSINIAAAVSGNYSNRIAALADACNHEFSVSDINEVWISMQEVVDAEYWDNFSYLHDWLKVKYGLMDARVKGGERFVRLNMLMRIIAED